MRMNLQPIHAQKIPQKKLEINYKNKVSALIPATKYKIKK